MKIQFVNFKIQYSDGRIVTSSVIEKNVKEFKSELAKREIKILSVTYPERGTFSTAKPTCAQCGHTLERDPNGHTYCEYCEG